MVEDQHTPFGCPLRIHNDTAMISDLIVYLSMNRYKCWNSLFKQSNEAEIIKLGTWESVEGL